MGILDDITSSIGDAVSGGSDDSGSSSGSSSDVSRKSDHPDRGSDSPDISDKDGPVDLGGGGSSGDASDVSRKSDHPDRGSDAPDIDDEDEPVDLGGGGSSGSGGSRDRPDFGDVSVSDISDGADDARRKVTDTASKTSKKISNARDRVVGVGGDAAEKAGEVGSDVESQVRDVTEPVVDRATEVRDFVQSGEDEPSVGDDDFGREVIGTGEARQTTETTTETTTVGGDVDTERTIDGSELGSEARGEIESQFTGPIFRDASVEQIEIGERPDDTDAVNDLPAEQRQEIRERAAEDSIFGPQDLAITGVEQTDDGTEFELGAPETRLTVDRTRQEVQDFGGGGGFGRETMPSGGDPFGFGDREIREPEPVETDDGFNIISRGEDFPDTFGEVSEIDFGRDEVLSTDLPVTDRDRRFAVADRARDAVGIDIDPVRAGREFRDETLDALDPRDFEPADVGGEEAGGIVGAAAFGVAAPEPVSTGVGAGVLGGVAIGGGVAAAANSIAEVDVPEDRSEIGPPPEVGVPSGFDFGGDTFGVGEITVPDERAPAGEVSVPDRTPSTTRGEIDVPEQTPQDFGSEVGVPTIDTQQLVGRQEGLFQEEEEQINQPDVVIGEEERYIPIDPFGPVEQGGTPDRFIRDDRDAFVFPGSNPSTIEPQVAEETTRSDLPTATETVTDTGFGDVFGVGPIAGGRADSAVASEPMTATMAQPDQFVDRMALPTVFQNPQATAQPAEFATPTETLTENLQSTQTLPQPQGRPRRQPEPELPEFDIDREGVGGVDEGIFGPDTSEFTNPIASGAGDLFGPFR